AATSSARMRPDVATPWGDLTSPPRHGSIDPIRTANRCPVTPATPPLQGGAAGVTASHPWKEWSMSLGTDPTLAGYARTAVTLKTRMDAYCHSTGGRRSLTAFAQAFNDNATPDQPATPHLIDVIHRLAASAWRVGQPYVLAPAITAIVAAAAD